MYYECIVNIFNREILLYIKKVYNEDFVNFVLNIFLVCKWKLINSVKDNFY